MSKRFTDTDKWKKQFFKKLPTAYKLFWLFICDDCDHSGIWQVEDSEMIKLRLGENIDLFKAIEFFNKDEERVRPLNNGKKWFLIPFPSFQYGDLNPNNKLHLAVRRELEKEDLLALTPVRGPLQRVKEKDKDKEKVVRKEKGAEKENHFHPLAELWNDVCLKQPRVREMSASRMAKCPLRLNDRSLENWRLVFEKINASRFCNGDNRNGWIATFDWIIANDENAVRVLEGKYDGRSSSKSLLDEISSK